MMSDAFHLLVVFTLSTVLFGTIGAAFLLRWKGSFGMDAAPLALLGAGLSAFVISWVLNVVLVLFPGLPGPVVVIAVLLVFATVGLNARSGWNDLRDLLRQVPDLFRSLPGAGYVLFTVGMALGAMVLLSNKPLADHDILEYGTQGRIFLRDMAIRYEAHHFDQATGFYYVGLHGFAFPLLFTWEGLIGQLIGSWSDVWVRLLTPYYAWLTVSFLWAVLRGYGPWVGLWVSALFALTLGFIYLNTIYHVDPFRLFLFTAAFSLFMVAMRDPQRIGVVLWGVAMGAHAMTHSLGMILAPFMLASFLFFALGGMKQRIESTVLATGCFLVAGGLHYVVDILFGTGWLFKDITWF
jgi:hypothetical protein